MTSATTDTTLAAALFRSGWRHYVLRAGDEVLGSIRRRGLIRTWYDLRLEDMPLTLTRQWNGKVELWAGDERVAMTQNVARRRVQANLQGRPPIELTRRSWSGAWRGAPRPGTLVRFVPHPRWPDQPVVTIRTAGPFDPREDPFLVAVGLGLVLYFRRLTWGLVPGRSLADSPLSHRQRRRLTQR